MIKSALLLVLWLSAGRLAAQPDSLNHWIGLIGRASVEPTRSYVPNFWIDSNCIKILRMKESYKFPLLIEALEDPEKTFAVHVILTKLLDTQSENHGNSG